MLRDVVAVEVVGPYRLRLTFEDGVAGEVDVARLVVFEGVFAPLAELGTFGTVRVAAGTGTVVWRNGADLDPDILYAEVTGVPVEQRLALAPRRERPLATWD